MEAEDKAQLREEMAQIQSELQSALTTLRTEAKSKLKAEDWKQIEQEFADLDEMLERLKNGYIWLAVVGKVSVGKSSTINAILEADEAKVEETHDTTRPPSKDEVLKMIKNDENIYTKDPWKIIDLPGIMGKVEYEAYALEQAKKAHGQVFVIAGEPHQDEIEAFDKVYDALPNSPKFVFVNKSDYLDNMPSRDRDAVKTRIKQKMGKYVDNNMANIVYGSAMLFDRENNCYARQELPQLIERMYEDAGTFGAVVTGLDPANLAHDLNEKVQERLLEARMKIARKVISAFGTASAVSAAIPILDLFADPGIMVSMVYVLSRIMGQQLTKERARTITIELLKACASTLTVEFVGVQVVKLLVDVGVFIPAVQVLAIPVLGAMAVFRYRRTTILGEVSLTYIKNGFRWTDKYEAQKTIIDARDRFRAIYGHLTNKVGEEI